MIGKVTRGRDAGGLLRYLFGPGRANEHLEPRLVASWRGDDLAVLAELEPTVVAGRRDVAPLAARMTLPLQLQPEVDRPVWQCSMRTADEDRRLSDAEWAEVAQDVVHRTGFAPRGDEAACRWVAVRHADDHIHIAVVLARMDGHPVGVFRDWPKVHAAARAAEQRLGLRVVTSPNRTASVAPTRAESEKAARTAAAEPARRWLTRQVRVAAAGSTSRQEFAGLLTQRGVLVMWRESHHTPGQLTGYAIARPGDIDAAGRQVWFGGSKLAPDLSLPKLETRWAETAPTVGAPDLPRPRAPLGAAQRRAALSRAEAALRRAGREPNSPSTAIAVGEVATVVADLVEGASGGPLTRTARRLTDTARQPRRRRPSTSAAPQPLRNVAAELSLLANLAPQEHRKVVLIAAHLVRIADAFRAAPGVASLPRTRSGPDGPQASHATTNRTPPALPVTRPTHNRPTRTDNPRRRAGPPSAASR